MPAEIRVPVTLGESVIEATVGKWLKGVGDTIALGDVVVELETDKVNLEVYAESVGVLDAIVKPAGSVVGVGEVLGTMGAGANGVAATPTEVAPDAAPVAAIPTPSTPGPVPVPRADNAQSVVAASPAPSIPGAAPAATPVARRIAAEGQIDLAQVQGSGPGGRITKQDVAQARAPVAPSQEPAPAARSVGSGASSSPPAPAPEAPDARREQRSRMSRRRQTIARRLVEAQHTAAMLTTFNEVDMTAIMEVRKRRKDSFKERHGIGLGFMSFFTRATIGALKAFPRLNGEIQGDEIVLKSYYDIGIAVGAEEGLVVPVVRDADRKGFAEIERAIADLAARARANTLSLADLQGGTFTITNGGVFGSLLSTPILNSPQVGILGMHKIEDRPIALAGQVVIRPMMYLALSYDHRLVDGSEAVRFLVRIKELLEDPERLLLEG